jgi:hypothetical protein
VAGVPTDHAEEEQVKSRAVVLAARAAAAARRRPSRSAVYPEAERRIGGGVGQAAQGANGQTGTA